MNSKQLMIDGRIVDQNQVNNAKGVSHAPIEVCVPLDFMNKKEIKLNKNNKLP